MLLPLGWRSTMKPTLERVHDYCGLVADLDSLKKMLNIFESIDQATSWEDKCLSWETQSVRFENYGKSKNIALANYSMILSVSLQDS